MTKNIFLKTYNVFMTNKQFLVRKLLGKMEILCILVVKTKKDLLDYINKNVVITLHIYLSILFLHCTLCKSFSIFVLQ